MGKDVLLINPLKKKSDFDDERKENPERYRARIECNPGVAEDAFFKNTAALNRSFKTDLPNPIDPDTGRFKSWFMCKDDFARFGHVDLAKNRDRAAVAFVHPYDMSRREEKTEEGKTIVVEVPLIAVDFITYFTAVPGGEVDFEKVRTMILEFVDLRGFRIELLTFDGYQSVQMRQIFESKGITCDELSVDRTRNPYEAWQDAMYEGRFISYYVKELVEEEIPFLIDFKGRKIEHRMGRGKDGADAVAGAVYNCVSFGYVGSLSFFAE